MINFSERLDDLISDALEKGTNHDKIISDLELKLMAMREEAME